jgi:hypothetical protein
MHLRILKGGLYLHLNKKRKAGAEKQAGAKEAEKKRKAGGAGRGSSREGRRGLGVHGMHLREQH